MLSSASCDGASSSDPAGTGGSAGALFADSPCASCDRSACDAQVKSCETDPECAAFLACEGKCPVGATGDVDSACQAACALPASSAGKGKLDALGACRQSGPGSACAPCGRSMDAGTDAGGDAGAPGCTMPSAITQSCAPATADTPCTECHLSKCCDAVSAVFDGGPGTDLTACWLDCTSAQCQNDCFDQFPAGVPALGGYQACVFLNCSAKGACKAPKPCSQCQFDSCGCEYASCLVNADCFRILNCFNTCAAGDVACGFDCRKKYPAGDQLYDRFAACVGQACILVCGA